jgi:hypothetical protein
MQSQFIRKNLQKNKSIRFELFELLISCKPNFLWNV